MRKLSKYISGGAVTQPTQVPKYVPEEEAAFNIADQQAQQLRQQLQQQHNFERFRAAVQRIPDQVERRRRNLEILNEYYNYIYTIVQNIPMDMYFQAGINPNIFRHELQLLNEDIEDYENGRPLPNNIFDAFRELRENVERFVERFLEEQKNEEEQENVNVLPTN